MKKIILILSFFTITITGLVAQAPPPPPSDATNGGTNGPVGGPLDAPIDGGLTVFLTFAAACAAWQWRKSKKLTHSEIIMP
ncbi:MAG: hypothetical protein NT004_07085 [Bacteroidetes bacterium]|nr:hypothetical protein [Bacteroidota bacterium]